MGVRRSCGSRVRVLWSSRGVGQPPPAGVCAGGGVVLSSSRALGWITCGSLSSVSGVGFFVEEGFEGLCAGAVDHPVAVGGLGGCESAGADVFADVFFGGVEVLCGVGDGEVCGGAVGGAVVVEEAFAACLGEVAVDGGLADAEFGADESACGGDVVAFAGEGVEELDFVLELLGGGAFVAAAVVVDVPGVAEEGGEVDGSDGSWVVADEFAVVDELVDVLFGGSVGVGDLWDGGVVVHVCSFPGLMLPGWWGVAHVWGLVCATPVRGRVSDSGGLSVWGWVLGLACTRWAVLGALERL